MEFHEKLQSLRKQKGLTQEELAQALYVSRTAISKWESGRGYPNIDSLKRIAVVFSVTVDDLLSSDELLTLAREDTERNENRFRDLVFGLLDLSVLLFFFLPFFGQKAESGIAAVSLLSLSTVSLWLKTVYIVLTVSMAIVGVLMLALQNCRHSVWMTMKTTLSMSLHAMVILSFVIGSQPYAVILLFVFFVIKALMLRKHP